MRQISESAFWAEYRPVKNELNPGQGFDDCLFETVGNDARHVARTWAANPDTVWTIVEGDTTMSILPGLHHVDRFGYLITENPRTEPIYCEVG